MADSALENRLAELEIKLAFQEQTLEQLNASLSEQAMINLTLQRQFQQLQLAWQKFAQGADFNSASASAIEMPPHY